MSRGRQTVRPVIVEVKPASARSKPVLTPTSPGLSPKAVRFTEESLVKENPRHLTSTEAWSLWHFETHSLQCRQCHNPDQVLAQGDSLCSTGHALAQDVAEHVYYRAGEVWSLRTDNHKHVRVDVPRDYDQLKGLLRGMQRTLMKAPRMAPIISYDRTYPVAPRCTQPDNEYDDERVDVVIEPESSERRRHGRTKHKESGYRTVLIDDEPHLGGAVGGTRNDHRRGSLYLEDLQRQRKQTYDVEIREPARTEQRRRHTSGIWD